VLASAGKATDPSEASIKPAAVQKSLHRRAHDRSEGASLGLESLLVGIDIVVEVLVE